MTKEIFAFKFYLFVFTILISFNSFSQEEDSDDGWDNQAYIGNKVAWGSEKWRYSGELQIRLKNDFQSLDRWYIEGVATYLLSEKFEIIPDFRVSIKPDEVEYRPGLGVLHKFYKNKFQFVNQFKWQIDIDKHNSDHAVRYAIFINKQISNRLIVNYVAGAVYRWREGFNGIQFIRTGPGITRIFNDQHTINFNYYLSIDNDGENWQWAGIPSVQLIINIDKDYKYLPAKFFSF